MARVTFINAIVSGKLGGTVYSRNKAGYYIKAWSMPLDPATTAQLNNRGRLSSSASAWHALTDIQKQAWNSYANGIYIPKDRITSSAGSGFTAFTGLRNAALFANDRKRAHDVTAPASITMTNASFETSTVPPAVALSGNIQDSTGGPLAVKLSSVTLDSTNGDVTFAIDFDRAISAAPVFEDAIGSEPVGMVIELSNGFTQEAQFVTNPNYRIIDIVAPPTVSGTFTAVTSMTFETTAADLPISDFKDWYSPDQYAQAKLYLLGQSGQYKFIGAKKFQID